MVGWREKAGWEGHMWLERWVGACHTGLYRFLDLAGQISKSYL